MRRDDPRDYPLARGESGQRVGRASRTRRARRDPGAPCTRTVRTAVRVGADAARAPWLPSPALTATGAEDVRLDAGPVDFRVRASRARLVDGHLVVPVEVTNESGADGSA
ncbi:hypothetical protein AB6N24_09515 [Cellulomonas sp. 179-A 4D5 NHS]|uniref:hypothetical protein n=1 Tax=Cellulomonas sp. 179-A 4D5 NHS TaxID=3142378 RepID=UPI00399F7FC3